MYALLENRLPPLWAHMDFGVPKCYKVHKNVKLQPLWAHRDFEAAMATKMSAVQEASCNFVFFMKSSLSVVKNVTKKKGLQTLIF